MVDMDIDRVDLVKEGADDNAFIKYYKDREGGPKMTFKEIIAKLKPEDKQIIEAEVEAQFAKAKEKVEKEFPPAAKKKEGEEDDKEGEEKAPKGKKKEEPKEGEEDFFKSLDPRVKAMFETISAKAEAAEAVAKSLVAKELDTEAVAKAKEVAGIGADEAKLVEIYKSLQDTDPALCTEVFNIFKTAANVKEAGSEIFETVVKTKGQDTSGGSAWEKIMAEATEVAKAKGTTEASAISEVVKAKPELYREYLKELRK